ncbi:MAG: transaldolase [Chlamydiae bacterium]|nr:transaldolase [Chlamydiota bacterium]
MTLQTLQKNKLDQLKKMTTVVADTSDFLSIAKYKPTDATTNPSLIYKASQDPKYSFLIDEAISFAKNKPEKEKMPTILDKLLVNFASEILKQVPGRVSIEVDARLSFDTDASVKKAKQIIALFEEKQIPRERILIKLASTWEGLLAAEKLEKEKIHCNMTLIFSLAQAIKAADVKATLISPFVGRILDWFKKFENKDKYAPSDDPGVKSVTAIYNYYKKFDYTTQIMGASFRNIDEIIELAGCDLLTISPQLLDELQKTEGELYKKLDFQVAKAQSLDKKSLDEKGFRFMLNEDQMATEKLSEGIRLFIKDTIALEKLIFAKMF